MHKQQKDHISSIDYPSLNFRALGLDWQKDIIICYLLELDFTNIGGGSKLKKARSFFKTRHFAKLKEKFPQLVLTTIFDIQTHIQFSTFSFSTIDIQSIDI